MKTFNVPTAEDLTPESLALLEILNKRLGKIPNLFSVIAYSSPALSGYLQFEQDLKRGQFNPRYQEAIALVVSEVNACSYCLAGHTAAAISRGFTIDQTLALRSGHSQDPKLEIVLQLAQSIALNRGEADQRLVGDFFEAGYSEPALIVLVGLVTLRLFTNYVYAITKVPIDFPLVQSLIE